SIQKSHAPVFTPSVVGAVFRAAFLFEAFLFEAFLPEAFDRDFAFFITVPDTDIAPQRSYAVFSASTPPVCRIVRPCVFRIAGPVRWRAAERALPVTSRLARPRS